MIQICFVFDPELQRRSSKVLEKRSLWSWSKVGNPYQASTTLGLEPVSIVHYTRPGSSIKRPTPNYLATQRHVNWPVVYPESSYKIMDPVSAALPQNLRRIFIATLVCHPLFKFHLLVIKWSLTFPAKITSKHQYVRKISSRYLVFEQKYSKF